jgi:hypothetical protein
VIPAGAVPDAVVLTRHMASAHNVGEFFPCPLRGERLQASGHARAGRCTFEPNARKFETKRHLMRRHQRSDAEAEALMTSIVPILRGDADAVDVDDDADGDGEGEGEDGEGGEGDVGEDDEGPSGVGAGAGDRMCPRGCGKVINYKAFASADAVAIHMAVQ